MIIIELEGKEYTMPSSWEEVNLKKFEDIMGQLSVFSEYKSQNQYALDLIQILTEAPKEQLVNMTRASFTELSNSIKWINEPIKTDRKNTFTINGEEYMAVENLNALSMGDTVSLEILINDSKGTLELNILPILIRKTKEIIKNGQVVKVPGEFDADNYEETRELFKKHLNITEVLWIKDFF